MDFSKKPQQKSLNEGASPISRLFLLWMAPLLWKGMKNGLTQNDLTKCMPKDRSDVLGDNLESELSAHREWKRELEMATKCQRKPRLWRALLRLHLLPLVGYGFLQFLDNFVLRTLRTPVLRQLIAQFQKPTNKISIMNGSEVDTYHKFSSVNGFAHHMWNDSFWLATILISMTFITALVNEHSYYGLVKLGPRMRASCCSLLYRKSLRLSTFEANQTSSGYVVNLVSNDLARLDDAVFYIHYIWIFPSQIIFVVYLIWEGAQWAAILGVIALLLQTIPFHTISSYFITALFRHKVALLSDNRIGIMNELIHGIQLIKMYAWELPFRKIVAEARRLEIKQIRYASYIQSMGQSTMDFVGRSTLFISIAAYVIMGYRISADLVYSLAQYFQLLQLGACAQYPLALSNGAEALVSLKRIEEFLLKKEKNETELGVERRNCSTHSDENTDAIEINGVSASWDEKNAVKTLKQITLKIKPGQLCTIAGPVGEGKSSLIQLLLGELPVQSGNVVVNGSISYAAQEPWIFFGTVRNNILFGQTYDKNRYSEVVECCALTKDFEQLPLGDRTVISDRGASLSGGQRIRISLARAIYKMASIYLFDDPLSAVDAPVSKHLFDHVIGPNARLAKNATRILITHNVHFLKEADVIVVMENGQITYHGTYANLSESDVDFAKLLQRTDRNDGKKNEESQQILGGDTVACENSENTLHVGQILNGEDDIGLRRRSKSIASIASQHFEHLQIDEEEKAEAKIWRIILYYLLAGTGWCGILFMFLINICTQMMLGGCDYYVNYFINQESKRKTNAEGLLTQMEYLYIYAAIIIAIISIGILRGVYFFQICMRSSKVLHDKMFRNIMEAPISFFTTNPSGRILNRFSNDMGIIDEFMPCVMFASLQSVTGLIGIVVLILIVNPAMIWAFLVSMILFLLIIKLFTRSSQDLRRLEGICRSPILSHLTASISGRTTIRTRGIERKMCQEFDELQDVHSSVWQLSRIACEAFGLWAHCLCAMFLASLIFSYIFIYQNSSSEDVGLAISQCLMLTTYLVNGLQQTLSLIQQTTSVERIAQYTEIDPEMGPTKRPPIEWPNNGKIKMQNMSLHYNLKDPPILKRITLDIQPGSKIGVVGRTGAGKSSLIAALFRLAHIEGLIEIDGIDTGTIALDSLRSKISIIPQDPVLFSGTIRRNLDPFEEYSDDDIWKTLDDVQLKEIVTFAGGLNMQVMASGINLSVGQRQLVCLARAILRNNCILVIDEATANVDIRTDQMIQRTIRDKFADCTVLTVAHRLNTIIDSDRILVMDAGECVAFDTPFNLLNKSVLCA